MEFTYQTITQDSNENTLPTGLCHIEWTTDGGEYTGIIGIPFEAFVGSTDEQKVAYVEAEIRQLILAKISASSFNFNGTATVED